MSDLIPNLDCMDVGDLIQIGVRGATRLAEQVFPDRPAGYKLASNLMVQYAELKARAMTCRAAGDINKALSAEVRCDRIHAGLPVYARW